MYRFSQIILLLSVISCQSIPENAQKIVDQSIQAHGGEVLKDHSVTFDFRDKSYSVNRNTEGYCYTRAFKDSIGYVIDSVFNSTDIKRFVDGQEISLSAEWQGKYASSVNSVLYFFQLPYLLNDPAVNKYLQAPATLGNATYDVIKVTFSAEGGGEDFEDTYMYWFNQETHFIDYLAYNYQVEGGGTRFRKAINRRTINGLVVQDYINYKATEKFPSLEELPHRLMAGDLIELSKIINENVVIKN